MRTPNTLKRLAAGALAAAALAGAGGCRDYLDVNTNPNGPQQVTANLYLPPMLHWMVTAVQFDGRFVGQYTQQWMLPVAGTVPNVWDRHGFVQGSDAGGEIWRTVYWTHGQNLQDMNARAEAEQRWDLLGVGQVLRAWGWQTATDLNGEIIIRQAFDQTRFTFDFDSQEFAYQEVRRLLGEAIKNLQRTDGAVDPAYLARGDRMYNGDRTKWLKLAYALLALNHSHYSNKSTYNADSVIVNADKAFVSNADDALLQYPATSADNADFNFWGRTRGNITPYRQTQFVVNLMNGTTTGGVEDPRMRRMLAPSPDGNYRGVDPNVPNSVLTVSNFANGAVNTVAPMNFHGYVGQGGAQQPSRYLFADRSRLPVMTYAQVQFIKAEAAFRKGDRATALDAYRKGIAAHIDFVNDRNRDDNQTPTAITAAERSEFLASPRVVPAAGALTLSQIMTQKYIAQWAWGHTELWMDMRRHNYSPDVYPGFAPPSNLFPDNNGRLVQRLRPRFNSEYVWNVKALEAIGGTAPDYHTRPMWITQP